MSDVAIGRFDNCRRNRTNLKGKLVALVLIAVPALVIVPATPAAATGSDVTAVAVGDVYDMNDGKTGTATNGDTWINSWSSTGDSLVSFNDGSAFGGIGYQAHGGEARLVGDPNLNTSTFSGVTLAPGAVGGNRQIFNPGSSMGYHMGVYEQNGVWYDGITNYGTAPVRSAFIKSTNGGIDWINHLGQTNTAPALNSDSTSMFTLDNPSFVRYGQGQNVPDIDNAPTYDYMIINSIYMARVKRTDLPSLDKTKFQWYKSGGLDGSLDTSWSANQSDAGIMSGIQSYTDHTLPYSTGNIIYNYGLQKYMMMAFAAYWPPGESQSYTNWGSGLPQYHFYTSDHVWGPWTDIGDSSLWGSTVAEYLMGNQYTSADGKKMWVVTSGSQSGWTGWSTHAPWAYGFQYMPVYFSTGAVVKYEAENATLSGGVNVQTTYPAYSGTGYVTGFSGSTDKVHFDLTTNVNGQGWHIVKIRYTNPLHNANTMSVYVNGQKSRLIQLAENNSDNTTAHDWTETSNIYYFNNGTSNTLEIRCDSGDTCDGVKFDYIQVSTEQTYNEGQDIAPAATVTASSGTAASANKGYVDYSTEWTASGTTGWLNLDWGTTTKIINKVTLYDKADTTNQVTSGTLTFSDGSSVPVGKLQNDGKAGTLVTFPQKAVTWARFTVNSVKSGTTNAGLGEIMVSYDPSLASKSNLALNQTATASTSYLPSNPPSLAVDGNLGDWWAASSGSWPQWIYVDLGSTKPLGVVQWQSGNTVDVTSKYTLEGSNDTTTWTTLADHSGTGVTTHGYMADSVSGNYRYVRVTIDNIAGNHWASVSALEVYAGQPAPNQAINQPVTASSSAATNPAGNAVDGSLATSWAASSGSFPQSVYVDLGSTQPVGVVQWQSGYTDNSTSKYSLEGSNDASTWLPLADHSVTGVTTNGYMTDPVTDNYRYIRLTIDNINNGHPAAVSELEVYRGSRNLALNQTATASTSNLPANPPSLAVDGIFTNWWAASSGSWPQSIYVDLGSPQPLGMVRWQSGNTVDVTSTYTLEGSNDTTSWKTLADHSATGITTHGYMTDSVSGMYRYVRLTIDNIAGNHWASTSELEVYAPTNLALNEPVTASSTAPANQPGLAVDGSLASSWVASSTSFPQSIYVDLGSTQSLGAVQWQSGYTDNSTSKYTLEGSNDASTWTTMADHSATGVTTNGYMTDSVATSYRYVRLTIDSINNGHSAAASEFEVYRGPRNLAFNQQATASTSNLPANPPSLAVNGNLGDWWAASSGSFPQSIYVDLGSAQSLATVRWQTGNTTDVTTKYTIEGSTDANSWTPLADHSVTGITTHGYMTDSVTGSYRYVRVTIDNIDGGHWASVSELEVYSS